VLRDSDFELLLAALSRRRSGSDFDLRISEFKPVTIGSTENIEAPSQSSATKSR